MTAIERAEARLVASSLGPDCCSLGHVCRRCKHVEGVEAELGGKARDLLRGYIGAVKALEADHECRWMATGAADHECTGAETIAGKGCQRCRALADFERLFPEEAK